MKAQKHFVVDSHPKSKTFPPSPPFTTTNNHTIKNLISSRGIAQYTRGPLQLLFNCLLNETLDTTGKPRWGYRTSFLLGGGNSQRQTWRRKNWLRRSMSLRIIALSMRQAFISPQFDPSPIERSHFSRERSRVLKPIRNQKYMSQQTCHAEDR